MYSSDKVKDQFKEDSGQSPKHKLHTSEEERDKQHTRHQVKEDGGG